MLQIAMPAMHCMYLRNMWMKRKEDLLEYFYTINIFTETMNK